MVDREYVPALGGWSLPANSTRAPSTTPTTWRWRRSSALEWLLDRYRVTTGKASGIVNDPNDWGTEIGDPRYIIDLVKRVTTVSVETMAIVKALPPLEEAQT